VVGILIGIGAGTWLGQGLTRLYADFFHFPFLIFLRSPDIYMIATSVTGVAAVGGAARALYSALTLPPAVAMSPAAPTRYRQLGIERLPLIRHLSQLTMMALRHMIRWPVRSGMTILGIAMSGALLVTAFFTLDSLEFLIDTMFFRTDRQHATVNFTDERPIAVMQAVGQLPGVLVAEPYRSVAVRLRHDHYHRKLAIIGKSPQGDLSRVLGLDLNPLKLPETGLVLSENVAEALGVRRGDIIDVEILEGKRGEARAIETLVSQFAREDEAQSVVTFDKRGLRRVPVTEIIQSYMGLMVFMDLNALNEMMDQGPIVSGAYIAVDDAQTQELFKAIKALPSVSSIALQKAALVKFRETIAQNINIMTTVYVVLSVIIAFGVVYNSARIQLSERARSFASLRVLGFTRAEVSHVLLTELAILILLAIPISWVIGYAFAWATIQGFESDLYRIPFIIETSTYAFSSLVVLGAAAVSALIVRRRIDRLDLISVLKTRE